MFTNIPNEITESYFTNPYLSDKPNPSASPLSSLLHPSQSPLLPSHVTGQPLNHVSTDKPHSLVTGKPLSNQSNQPVLHHSSPVPISHDSHVSPKVLIAGLVSPQVPSATDHPLHVVTTKPHEIPMIHNGPSKVDASSPVPLVSIKPRAGAEVKASTPGK